MIDFRALVFVNKDFHKIRILRTGAGIQTEPGLFLPEIKGDLALQD